MSLAPTKGNCDGRNGRYNSCGATDIWLACKSRGQCKRCSDAFKMGKKITAHHKKEHPKQLKAALDKLEEIKLNQQYYLRAITDNILRNSGKCKCDECNEPIPHPTGRNVCHIVGSGANKKLYTDPRNNFILGKGLFKGECRCGIQFDDKGEKSTMKIYQKYLEVRTELNHKYYNQK